MEIDQQKIENIGIFDCDKLSDCLLQAKGSNRTWTQFASEAGVNVAMLSRIVNKKHKQPLSMSVLSRIYGAREDCNDSDLWWDLICANGFVSEKTVTSNRRWKPENLAITAKKILWAAIAHFNQSGYPVFSTKGISEKDAEALIRKISLRNVFGFTAETSFGDSTDGRIAFFVDSSVSSNTGVSPLDKFYKIFLNDANGLDCCDARKIAFIFSDEAQFSAFVADTETLNVKTDMCAMLVSLEAFCVIEEVQLPGTYDQVHPRIGTTTSYVR